MCTDRNIGPLALIVFSTLCLSIAPAQADQFLTYVQGEFAEYRLATQGRDSFLWDIRGWAGGDYDRLWFKTQGSSRIDGPVEKGEVQLRYSHLVSTFWDLAAGVRYDLEPSPGTGYAVFALHGLAPYFFEVDADLFVSHRGKISARLEIEYPIQITQRLILQPALEMNVAAQDAPEIGVGSGLSQIDLGLRLRYEIARELAPYVGFVWERKVGRTATFARERGEDYTVPAIVAGIRFWF